MVTDNAGARAPQRAWSQVKGRYQQDLSYTPPGVRPVATANHFGALDHDKGIVVDSGASAGFGDVDTPGTSGTPVTQGVLMCSATGNCKESMATDKFDLLLPDDATECHVLPQGNIQRPLLYVGKACDAGLDVWFSKLACRFCKDGVEMVKAPRDPRTSLWVLPSQVATTDNLPDHKRTVQGTFNDNTSIFDNCRNSRHDVDTSAAVGMGLPRQQTRFHAHTNAHEIDSVPRLIRHLHACAGFPKKETWIQAITRGCFSG